MNELNKDIADVFIIKFVQGGAIKSSPLNDVFNKKFKELYFPLLKGLQNNKKNVLLTKDER
jgi:hypothetical protein